RSGAKVRIEMYKFVRPFRNVILSFTSVFFLVFPETVLAQTRSLYMPTVQASGASEGSLALANSGTVAASVTVIGRGFDGTVFRGPRPNPVTVSVPPLNSKVIRTKDLFGENNPTGWVE